MFLSNREMALLTELMNNKGPVSLEHMMNLLKVSKRTVYRELSNLELSLKETDAKIEKVGREGFQIIADQQAIGKLQEAILMDNSKEFATSERQHGILLKLLTETQPVSIDYFLDKYMISNSTFFSDIRQLEEQLARHPLTIERNRGYEIKGSEKQRRLLLANTLVMEINEYQFFHLPEMEENHSFLEFIDKDHLIFAQHLSHDIIEPQFSDLSDRKLAFMIIMLTLAMDRVSKGFSLTEESYPSQVNKEFLEISKQLFAQIAKKTRRLYSVNEIVFFAMLLGDFLNSFDHDFFEENFDTNLAYRVKRLIGLVSQETEVDFYEDATLYKMLLTHISGVLTRTILEETAINNPILEKIMAQYTEIAAAICLSLPESFPNQRFSEEEIAYMVLHFANSLEKNPKVMEVNIAGISPSGLASTSMLEMQLRKHFPFINEIKFFRVSEIERLNIQEKYDLVISTALLPGYGGEYKLVSPLLLEEEVQQLKEKIKEINQHKQITRRVVPPLSNEDTYEEILALIAEINQLLARFSLIDIQNPGELEATIAQVLTYFPAEFVTNKKKVKEKLLRRYDQAPLGIPNTQFALFHASSEAVELPVFQIFDLSTPLPILAMDKQKIWVKRLLIMLAPYPVKEDTAKILGKISGAIIMNDLNVEIFNSGNQSIIFQLLSSLLIEEVKR